MADIKLIAIITLNVSIFGLLVDSFLRLKKIVTNQDIALKTNQMYLHIGAFGVSCISVIALSLVLFFSKLYYPSPEMPNFY